MSLFECNILCRNLNSARRRTPPFRIRLLATADSGTTGSFRFSQPRCMGGECSHSLRSTVFACGKRVGISQSTHLQRRSGQKNRAKVAEMRFEHDMRSSRPGLLVVGSRGDFVLFSHPVRMPCQGKHRVFIKTTSTHNTKTTQRRLTTFPLSISPLLPTFFTFEMPSLVDCLDGPPGAAVFRSRPDCVPSPSLLILSFARSTASLRWRVMTTPHRAVRHRRASRRSGKGCYRSNLS